MGLMSAIELPERGFPAGVLNKGRERGGKQKAECQDEFCTDSERGD
jgi:hypothetical protein